MFPVDVGDSNHSAGDGGRETPSSSHYSIRVPVISARRFVHDDELGLAGAPPAEPRSRSSEITTQTASDAMGEVAVQLEPVSVSDMSVGTNHVPTPLVTPAETQTCTQIPPLSEAETQTLLPTEPATTSPSPPSPTPPSTSRRTDAETQTLLPTTSPSPPSPTPPSTSRRTDAETQTLLPTTSPSPPSPTPPSTSRRIDADTQTQEKKQTSRQTEPALHLVRQHISNIKLPRSNVNTPHSSDISLGHGTSEGSSTLSLRPTMTTSIEKELASDASRVLRQKQVRSARARRIKDQKTGEAAASIADEPCKTDSVIRRPKTAGPRLTTTDDRQSATSDVDSSSKMSALSLLVGRCMQVALQEARHGPEQRRITKRKELVNTYLWRAIAEDDDAQQGSKTSPLITSYIRMSVARMAGDPTPAAAVSQEELIVAVNKFVRYAMAPMPVEDVIVADDRPQTAGSEASVFAVKACLKNAVDQLQRDVMRGHVTAESTTSETNALARRAEGCLTVPQVDQGAISGTSDIVRECLQMALDDFRGAVSRREFTREKSDTRQLVRGYLDRALRAVHSVMGQWKASELPPAPMASVARPVDDVHITSRMSLETETLIKKYIRRALSPRYDEVWRTAVLMATASGVVRRSMRQAFDDLDPNPSPSPSDTSTLINNYIRQAVESVLTTDVRWAQRAGDYRQPSRSSSVELINECLERARQNVDNENRQLSRLRLSQRTAEGTDSEALAALVDAYIRVAVDDYETIRAQDARPLESARHPRTTPVSPENSIFSLRRGFSQSEAFSHSSYTPSSTSTEASSDASKRRHRGRRRQFRPAAKATMAAKWNSRPTPPSSRKSSKHRKNPVSSGENLVRVTSATVRQHARRNSSMKLTKKKSAQVRDDAGPPTNTDLGLKAKKLPRRRSLLHDLAIEGKVQNSKTKAGSLKYVDVPTGEQLTDSDSCCVDYDKVSETSDLVRILEMHTS